MLDPASAALIAIALVTILLVSGAHISVGMGLGGLLGMYLTVGPDGALAQLATVLGTLPQPPRWRRA